MRRLLFAFQITGLVLRPLPKWWGTGFTFCNSPCCTPADPFWLVGWRMLLGGGQAGFAPLPHPGGISWGREVFQSVIKASPNEASILPGLHQKLLGAGLIQVSAMREFALACIQLFLGFPLPSSESCCLLRTNYTYYRSSGSHVLNVGNCVSFFCCTWLTALTSRAKNWKLSLSLFHLMCYRTQVRDRRGFQQKSTLCLVCQWAVRTGRQKKENSIGKS